MNTVSPISTRSTSIIPTPTSSAPDVSVIMPTYNCLEYLPRAVDSVLSQSVDLELLIVDDCSDDGSDLWLAQLAQSDHRVKVIKGQHNGVSAARNLALQQARGEWVAFLDADDYWYAGKLALQLALHQQVAGVILSFTDYDHFSEQDEDLGTCFNFWPRFHELAQKKGIQESKKTSWVTVQPFDQMMVLTGKEKTAIYEENVIGTSTVMVKRQALQNANGFDEALHSASDWDLWLKLLDQGDFAAINQPLMGYLMRSNSISRNVERRLASFETIVQRYKVPMMKLNQHCYGPAAARLQLAWAECWQQQSGGYWRAIRAYFLACYRLPSQRNLKAFLSHLIKGGLRAFHGN